MWVNFCIHTSNHFFCRNSLHCVQVIICGSEQGDTAKEEERKYQHVIVNTDCAPSVWLLHVQEKYVSHIRQTTTTGSSEWKKKPWIGTENCEKTGESSTTFKRQGEKSIKRVLGWHTTNSTHYTTNSPSSLAKWIIFQSDLRGRMAKAWMWNSSCELNLQPLCRCTSHWETFTVGLGSLGKEPNPTLVYRLKWRQRGVSSKRENKTQGNCLRDPFLIFPSPVKPMITSYDNILFALIAGAEELDQWERRTKGLSYGEWERKHEGER